MPIDTRHAEVRRNAPRWQTMADALDGEDVVQEARTRYLPRTGGMEQNDAEGAQYDAYRLRARFPEVTAKALTGIVGLLFEKDPIGASGEVIGRGGKTDLQLARNTVRAVAARGREILVVDAPPASRGGGTPFVTRYRAESLVNWKIDPEDPSTFSLAVFEEEEDVGGLYEHDTRVLYRRYRRTEEGEIEVSRWVRRDQEDVLVEDPLILPVPWMPIIAVGSIDIDPPCDPLPLLPVARCALAYYRKSGDYEHGLHVCMQPTPTVAGVTEEEYDAILEQGIGSSALWSLGPDGRAAFLEASGTSLAEAREAMDEEIKQAESHAVQLTQRGAQIESGKSMGLRAAMQHASIYSIADSVSIGITRARAMRAAWAGERVPADDFALRTDFSDAHASEQMINALNSAVNSGNAPRSALFNAIRQAGLSEKTDAEMLDEIESSGAPSLGVARPPAPPPDARRATDEDPGLADAA